METTDRWKLNGEGIVWNVADDARLPHSDHVEMSGRGVSVIVRYAIDADRRLSLSREIIWPTLRLKKDDVRGYLKRTFGDPATPRFTIGDARIDLATLPVAQISFDGLLTIAYEPVRDCVLSRVLFPSTDRRAVFERWRIANLKAANVRVQANDRYFEGNVPDGDGFRFVWKDVFPAETVAGFDGEFVVEPRLQPTSGEVPIPGGGSGIWTVVFAARRASEPDPAWDEDAEEAARRERIYRQVPGLSPSDADLQFISPDPVLNRAFSFAKVRATESLFDTKMGLVHSPGGGRYYGGVWANDQAEYSGPLFGYLGGLDTQAAALNAYRRFAAYMTPEFQAIPSSLEVEGDVAWSGAGDRGDAAMIASGASRFALATGDRAIADELFPTVAWCLEYCRRKTNADGVVESDSDELEGRFPTGDANLSTSCLAYDGLRRGADLARAVGKPDAAAEYDARADALAGAIDAYFGATVEGFETYRYYAGNTTLRAWICLPLTVGLTNRAAGTIDALFSPRLWTDDGLATEAGDTVFWDRSTLYALRGVFAAGEPDRAWEFFSRYLRRRLLGDHVPYAIEAHPEGGQAHLSAESALLCRVVTEGILGIVPTGLRSFRLTVNLPKALRFIDLNYRGCKIEVRDGGAQGLSIRAGEKRFLGPNGTTYDVTLDE